MSNNQLSKIRSDQDLASMGWFDNHPAAGASLPMTPELNAYIGPSWPMSENYYNPLNPLWLMQVFDVRLLLRRPFWFVRDGLVPLAWFFHKHPNPPSGPTTLLIDEDFTPFVPEAWRSHVGTYRLHSEAPVSPEARTGIAGLASESYASLPFVRERIRFIADHDKDSTSFDLYLPSRWLGHNDEEREIFHCRYFREVMTALPDRVRMMTRSGFCSPFDPQNVRLWDLNEKLMVADNTLIGHLLKKGAQWPLSRPKSAGEMYKRLSSFHGYMLNMTPSFQDMHDRQSSLRAAQRFHEREDQIYQTSAFMEFPWPSWFVGWVRSEAPPSEPGPARDGRSGKTAKAKKKPKPKKSKSRAKR